MSALPPKPLGVFCLHAALLTGLIGLWPTPRQAYPALFHAHANALLGGDGERGLRFESPPPGSGRPDTRLSRSVAGRPQWRSEFSLRRIGYWPSAALAALLLATPLAPLRRAGALAAGLLLLDAFTLGRLAVEVAYLDYELAHGPGAPARGLLHLLLRTGSESLTATVPSLAAVAVCWVAVARPGRRIALPFAPGRGDPPRERP